MICKKCGHEFKDDLAQYCPMCGKKLQDKERAPILTNAEYLIHAADSDAVELMEQVKRLDAPHAVSFLRQMHKNVDVYCIKAKITYSDEWDNGMHRDQYSRSQRVSITELIEMATSGRVEIENPTKTAKGWREISAISVKAELTFLCKTHRPEDFEDKIFKTLEETNAAIDNAIETINKSNINRE